MRNILTYLVVSFTLLFFVACHGGSTSGQNQQQAASTTATLAINLTGTLPSNTAIAGVDFTLTLPANVTPAITNNTVDNGVVTLAGAFAGGAQMPSFYTAATGSAPGTLRVTMVNAAPTGVTQVGEVATITLQLANGASPTLASFGVSSVSVVDAARYSVISGMGASLANLTLQ